MPLGWDGICCLDPWPARSPDAGKGLMGEWIMHWHIKGWINLGALQELSTEALSGFLGLPVSPTSKPRELWFPDSFPNRLLIHLMCLLCPGPYFGIPAGQGMPPAHQVWGWGCRGSLGVSAPGTPGQDGGSRSPGSSPRDGVSPSAQPHTGHQLLEVAPKSGFLP